MKRTILKGVILSNVILIMTSLLSFINAKYFILNIGLKPYGIIKVFTQLIGYITLAELGLGVAANYALYKPLANKDYYRVNEVLYTMKHLYNKIIIFVILAGAGMIFILPFVLKDVVVDYYIILYWVIYVLNTAFSYVSAKYVTLYTADQNYNFVKLVQGGSQILSQSLQLLSLIFYPSLLLFVSLNTINFIISTIIFKRYFNKNYTTVLDFNSQAHNIDKTIIKDIKDLFFHKLSYVLIVNTDLIIISMFISVETAAVYFSYTMIIKMLTTLVATVTSVITPNIGKFISLNDKNAVYLKFKNINIFYLYTALALSVTTYFLVQPFMMIWINNKFDSKLLIILLCLNLGISIYRKCLDVFKHSSGFFSDIHLPIIEAGINLVLSLLLVTRFGLVGIVIGTLVANAVIVLVYKPILTYRECFNQSFAAYVKDYLIYLIYTAIVILFSYLFITRLNIKITSFLEFFINGFIVFALVSLLTLCIFIFDVNLRKQVTALFRKVIIK